MLQVETLVVDEADLVLSFGYADDIRSVTKRLPKICQGFLMSATLSPELQDLKRVVLHRCVGDWASFGGGGRGCLPLDHQTPGALERVLFVR